MWILRRAKLGWQHSNFTHREFGSIFVLPPYGVVYVNGKPVIINLQEQHDMRHAGLPCMYTAPDYLMNDNAILVSRKLNLCKEDCVQMLLNAGAPKGLEYLLDTAWYIKGVDPRYGGIIRYGNPKTVEFTKGQDWTRLSGGPADEFIIALRELSFNVAVFDVDNIIAYGVLEGRKIRIGFSSDPMTIPFQGRQYFEGYVGFEIEENFDKWSMASQTVFESVEQMLTEITEDISL